MARRSDAKAPVARVRISRTPGRVADRLEIPYYVLDYETRFAKAVMGAFADSYLQGETPVPCVACNQKIKFHDLLETAAGLGASALATGHYVRSEPGPTGWELYRAADKERDQSYFLFATTREQLCFLRFPLGGLKKDETRKLARDLAWQWRRSRTARTSVSCRRGAIRK